MKKVTLTLLLCCFLLLPSTMLAQSLTDALIMSDRDLTLSARSLGMGNAYGAMGANPSSAIINPAGIGLYKNSDFNFTFNHQRTNLSNAFLGTTDQTRETDNSISNLSLNIYQERSENKRKYGGPLALQSYSFTFGVNRVSGLNRKVAISGINGNHSMIDFFMEQAHRNTGGAPNPENLGFYDGKAYDLFLIDTFEGEFVPAFFDENERNVSQTEEMNMSGRMSDYHAAMGFNFGDRLYLGATLGLSRLRFANDRFFDEANANPAEPNFQSMFLNESYDISGVGFRFRAGAIVRVVDNLRLGVSYQAPSNFRMTDNWTIRMGSQQETIGSDNIVTRGSTNYTFTSPARYTLSGTYNLGGSMMLSVDYEIVDMSSVIFDDNATGPGSDYSVLNQEINNNVQTQGIIRVGLEYLYDFFAFRAGFIHQQTPLESGSIANVNYDRSFNYFSGGIGYRDAGFYLEAAYMLRVGGFTHLPYTLENQAFEAATIAERRGNIMLTGGIIF